MDNEKAKEILGKEKYEEIIELYCDREIFDEIDRIIIPQYYKGPIIPSSYSEVLASLEVKQKKEGTMSFRGITLPNLDEQDEFLKLCLSIVFDTYNQTSSDDLMIASTVLEYLAYYFDSENYYLSLLNDLGRIYDKADNDLYQLNTSVMETFQPLFKLKI